ASTVGRPPASEPGRVRGLPAGDALRRTPMNAETETLLDVQGLTKNFGRVRAVDHISFSIPRGKIVGLLGPNAAGKTTTIHILLGIITRTAGRIVYFGKDFTRHRGECLQRINYASSFNTLQGRISVWENLLVFAHLYGVTAPGARIRELAAYFEV